MTIIHRHWQTPAALVVLLALAGCNDDSNGSGTSDSDAEYSGSTEAATLDDGNSEDLARATISAADRAISTETVQDASPFSPSTLSTSDPEQWILEQTGLMPEPDTDDGSIQAREAQPRNSDAICDAGGSVEFDTTQGPGGSDPEGDMEIRYDNCRISTPDGTATIDGTIDFSWTESDWTYTYNVTYSYRGETYTLNSTFSCSDIGTANISCSVSDTYTDSGTTYQLTDTVVVETANGDYDVDATVYHEDHGYVTFESTGLQLCSGGGFSHGTVEMSDSSDQVVLTLEFQQDCETVTAVYEDGTSDTFTY